MDDLSSNSTKKFHGGCPHDCADTLKFGLLNE